MAVELIVNNNSYQYSENGENPGWGEENTAWAEAVTNVLGTLQGSNDLPLSSAGIENGVTDQNVIGLAFNTSEVRQFRVEYTINRVYDNGGSSVLETGVLYGVNTETDFDFTQEYQGESGVTFSADYNSGGQITYSSDTLANYQNGVITFKASTMNKVL